MSVPSIAKKLGISLLSLLAVLVMCEILARIAEPGPFSLVDSNPYEPWGKSHVHKRSFSGRWDGTWYETNARGWRGPEFEPSFEADEFRVLALGDSCTFGKGVREQDSWPRQLETMLKERLGPTVKPMVGNLGVNGYAGKAYKQVLAKVVDSAKPDLVVLGYNLNDFPNIAQKVDQAVFQKKKLRSSIPRNTRRRMGEFAFYRLLRSFYYDMNREKDWEQAERLARQAPEGSPADAQRMQWEAQNLSEIVRMSREAGAEVAIFLFPYESMVYLDSYSTAPVERVRRLAETLDVEFVDMISRFREVAVGGDEHRSLFIRGDRYHPNEEGYQIVARNVTDLILEKGWATTSE